VTRVEVAGAASRDRRDFIRLSARRNFEHSPLLGLDLMSSIIAFIHDNQQNGKFMTNLQ
jgi:hypothetical protein